MTSLRVLLSKRFTAPPCWMATDPLPRCPYLCHTKLWRCHGINAEKNASRLAQDCRNEAVNGLNAKKNAVRD